jgi:hypothetical protein
MRAAKKISRGATAPISRRLARFSCARLIKTPRRVRTGKCTYRIARHGVPAHNLRRLNPHCLPQVTPKRPSMRPAVAHQGVRVFCNAQVKK